MGEGINFAEYTVARKAEGKNKLARVALVFAYVIFAVAYAFVFISIKIPQLIAILPLLLWIAVFFTWKYASYDISYKVEEGYFYVDKIVGKKRKNVFSIRVREANEIAPLSAEKMASHDKNLVADFRGTAKNSDAYYIKYTREDGTDAYVYTEMRAELVKVLHRLNEKTEVSKELRY